MNARDRVAYTALAALALSAPTVERVTMVADDVDENTRGESITLLAPPAPPAADYPRNRAERRRSANRARRGTPGRRR